MHEAWHFCGLRRRKDRFKHVIESAAYIIASAIRIAILPFSQYKEIKNSNILFQFEHFELEKKHKKVSASFVKNLQEILSERIRKMIDLCYGTERTEEFYYGNTVYIALIDSTINVLLDFQNENYNNFTGSSFAFTIYHEYMSAIFDLYEDSPDILGREYYQKAKLYQQNEKRFQDIHFVRHIQSILSYIAGNNLTPSKNLLVDGEDGSHKNKDNLWKKLDNIRTVESIYCAFKYLYKETFSDFMACCTIKPTIKEYILSFITDTSLDVKPFSLLFRKLRCGAVLDKYFKVDFNQKLRLQYSQLELEHACIDYRNDIRVFNQEITNELAEICEIYQLHHGTPVVKQMSDYLDCINADNSLNRSPDVNNYVTKLQDLVNKNREMLLLDDGTLNNRHDVVIDMYERMMNFWQELSKRKVEKNVGD